MIFKCVFNSSFGCYCRLPLPLLSTTSLLHCVNHCWHYCRSKWNRNSNSISVGWSGRWIHIGECPLNSSDGEKNVIIFLSRRFTLIMENCLSHPTTTTTTEKYNKIYGLIVATPYRTQFQWFRWKHSKKNIQHESNGGGNAIWLIMFSPDKYKIN